MDTEGQSIVELVKMMLRGISTDATIDPVTAALHFEQHLNDLDLDFVHADGAGYIIDGADPVMFAEFTDDGVYFDEHHEHPQTLKVIQCALATLTHLEQLALMPDDDADDDSDDDWV